jgi:hypothetical protein
MAKTQISSPESSTPTVREVIRTAAVVAASGVVVGIVGVLSVAGILGALWGRNAAPVAAD